ncbi:MAG: hypothetical protein HY505_01995 [Candidatus Yanofskybacteria bacterium]|nr:hypothetical protein [Candidatus Yanofskybacteria bacterium]
MPDYVFYTLSILIFLETIGLFLAVLEISRLDHQAKLLAIDKKYLEERLITRIWYSNNLKIVMMLREGNYSARTIQRQEFQSLLVETIELYEKIKDLNPDMSDDLDIDTMENAYAALLDIKNSLPI